MQTIQHIRRDQSPYPANVLCYLDHEATECITARGNRDILKHTKLGLFSSVKCPGNVILQTYDLARAVRDAGVVVIGGFHSPMEQECLALLLRGKQPIIICPARSPEGMRLPAEWKQAIEAGRLLILSPFEAKERRAIAHLAARRNEFVAALADEVLIAHAQPGGKTEALARNALKGGKTVYTLLNDDNKALVELGARPVSPDFWTNRSD